MDLLFKDACDSYISYCDLKLKPQSLRAIRSRITCYVLPYFGGKQVESISALDYLKWQQTIEGLNLSYKYKKSLHYSCVGLFNYCKRFYDLEKNIPSIVGNFKNKYEYKSNVDFFSYVEYRKFIDCVDDQIYRVLFNLLFLHGR